MTIKRSENAAHIKHLAYQLVAQLPEDSVEALQVLGYARRLVEQAPTIEEEPTPLKIVKKEP